MMPPEQEAITSTTTVVMMTSTTSNGSTPVIAGSPSHNFLNRSSDTGSVHAEPAPNIHGHNNNNNSNNNNNNNNNQYSISIRSSIFCESLRPVTLKFDDVAYEVRPRPEGGCFSYSHAPARPSRAVLRGATGVVRPGELMAMLGPSGSGKTTLLTALAGRLPGKVSGEITYNGRGFSGWVKKKTGFVAQDDALYPHLTVLETLTFAAMLRLPRGLSSGEKSGQAEAVVAELGLGRCRDSVVGGALLRGISGGERKRVSIGQEMLVNPSLLLLDEPTSGLDSTTAQRIVATLRGLARGGRTVVTTVHQPSPRLYGMFDKVLVLSDGCPLYSGPAAAVFDYFRSVGFAPAAGFGGVPLSPADFLLDLANGIATDIKLEDPLELHGKLDNDDQNSIKQHLILSYKKNLYPALKAEIQGNNKNTDINSSSSRGNENEWVTSWWEQFKVLLRRGLKERKHESYSGLRIFQVMSVSILSGLMWWHSDPSNIQDQIGLLFFFSIFWGFFPLFNSIFAFPQERPMLTKERSSGMYRLSSYYLARTAGDLPMELVLPTLFVAVTYWMGGLKPSPLTFALTLSIVLFNVLVSQGLGLALGAILMDVKQATTLASVTMLVFLLVGGYYIQRIPGFIAWLKYVSFSHYCYKLLVEVQYSDDEVYECGSPVGLCKVMDFPAIKCLGLDGMVWDLAALSFMFVGYRLLAYLALRMGQPH